MRHFSRKQAGRNGISLCRETTFCFSFSLFVLMWILVDHFGEIGFRWWSRWTNKCWKLDGEVVLVCICSSSQVKANLWSQENTSPLLLLITSFHYLKVCKVTLRTIILRDNIVRKHWWTIDNITYKLQLRYNKSNMVI